MENHTHDGNTTEAHARKPTNQKPLFLHVIVHRFVSGMLTLFRTESIRIALFLWISSSKIGHTHQQNCRFETEPVSSNRM